MGGWTGIFKDRINWNGQIEQKELTPTKDNDLVVKKYVDSEIDADILTHINTAQAHSDYMLNTGDTSAGNYTFNGIIYADGNVGGLGLDVLRSAEIGAHLIVGDDLTVDGTTFHVDSADNRVGIGTTTPAASLDIVESSTINLLINNLKTDNNNKLFRFGMSGYDSDEEPSAIIYGTTGSTSNNIRIGGGTSAMNAATNIRLITAANNTTTNGTVRLTIREDGKIGIGTTIPRDRFHIKMGGTGEYLNLQSNSTANGSDVRLGFSLTTSESNEPKTYIKGIRKENVNVNDLLFHVGGNDRLMILDSGNVGIGTITPTTQLSVKEKAGISPIGGIMIKLTNKTGGNTVAGQLVAIYSATAVDDAFKTQVASGDNTIGIVLDAGVADGSEAWIVVSGIADVLIDAGGSARGDRMISSATAGSADVWNVGGAVATHFLEIGHCIETRGGAGLARCVLHFN